MTQPPHQPGQLPDDSRAPEGGPGEPPVSPQTAPQTPTAAAPQTPTAAAPQTPTAAAPGQPTYDASGQPVSAAPGQPAYGAPGQPPQGAPGQPPYGGPGQPPYGAPGQPAYGAPGQPAYGAPGQAPYGVPGQPGAFGEPGALPVPAKKSRKWLIVGITAGVLALLAGGGVTAAVLVARDADAGRGAPSAGEAVTEFMRATYRDRDHDRAAELVCGQALDRQRLDSKINEIEELVGPSGGLFAWTDPTVTEESEQTATVTTTVKLTTNDERVSSVDLRFVVVRNDRWLVCEVS
ncbi:Rv0361 family membrane protein [Melissospora conviva]|uniref:Rv0361 family membrane protein n=1 Tax=Melissospora conviva TaxID=3388432 RepID=UPI003B7B5EE3